jgi:hypothetical protein
MTINQSGWKPTSPEANEAAVPVSGSDRPGRPIGSLRLRSPRREPATSPSAKSTPVGGGYRDACQGARGGAGMTINQSGWKPTSPEANEGLRQTGQADRVLAAQIAQTRTRDVTLGEIDTGRLAPKPTKRRSRRPSPATAH